MVEIINLRTVRKRAKRRVAEQQAASNRLTHGRPKLDRLLDKSRRDQESNALDRHRLVKDEPS